MSYVRSRYLLAGIAVCDAALLAGGLPLERFSWQLAEHPTGNVQIVVLVLLANLALLALALAGLLATTTLAQRGAWLLVRRYAVTVARPSSAQRTSIRR